MAQLNFDATQVEPQESFDPIPAGEYHVIIEDTEMKTTAAGTGEYLQITLSVLDGQYAGRKLWDRLNLSNPNKTAEEIAQRTLSAICHATGVLKPRDSAELHNKTLIAKVKVKQRPGYDPQNEIGAYKAAGQTQVAPVQPIQQSAPQPQPVQQAAGNVPPWQRSA